MSHLSYENVLIYAHGKASEEERIEIETHIAGCEACLSEVRSVLFLSKNFDQVWNAWTAEEHGRVVRLWQEAQSLTAVAAADVAAAAAVTPGSALRSLWGAVKEKKRVLIQQLTVQLDSAGHMVLDGIEGLLTPNQPAYATVLGRPMGSGCGPLDPLLALQGSWEIPVPDPKCTLGLRVKPSPEGNHWIVRCELIDILDESLRGTARLDVENAMGPLFSGGATASQEVRLQAGEATISLTVGQIVWVIPIQLGPLPESA